MERFRFEKVFVNTAGVSNYGRGNPPYAVLQNNSGTGPKVINTTQTTAKADRPAAGNFIRVQGVQAISYNIYREIFYFPYIYYSICPAHPAPFS